MACCGPGEVCALDGRSRKSGQPFHRSGSDGRQHRTNEDFPVLPFPKNAYNELNWAWMRLLRFATQLL
jgi:hypothetical protein